jgi:hypothetical protein
MTVYKFLYRNLHFTFLLNANVICIHHIVPHKSRSSFQTPTRPWSEVDNELVVLASIQFSKMKMALINRFSDMPSSLQIDCYIGIESLCLCFKPDIYHWCRIWLDFSASVSCQYMTYTILISTTKSNKTKSTKSPGNIWHWRSYPWNGGWVPTNHN